MVPDSYEALYMYITTFKIKNNALTDTLISVIKMKLWLMEYCNH